VEVRELCLLDIEPIVMINGWRRNGEAKSTTYQRASWLPFFLTLLVIGFPSRPLCRTSSKLLKGGPLLLTCEGIVYGVESRHADGEVS
jgi:hypothetical protein